MNEVAGPLCETKLKLAKFIIRSVGGEFSIFKWGKLRRYLGLRRILHNNQGGNN